MNLKYVIGGAVIVVLLVWGASAFFEATVQYVTYQEAVAGRRTVQVMGRIDFSQVTYDIDSLCLRFVIYDPEAASPAEADRLPVVYSGVVPGNFEQATSVVLKGKADERGTFVAEQMLVKCPSKYQGDNNEEFQDIRKHDEAQQVAPGS